MVDPRICERLDGVEVMQVIKIKLLKGEGTKTDPCRPVFQYWDMDGNFIAQVDPCVKSEDMKVYSKKL